MTRIEIPFTGPAYMSESPFLSPQECVNMYPRPYASTTGEALALFGTPGLVEWADLEESKAVRGLFPYGNYLYAVVGKNFKRIDSSGRVITVGTLLSGGGPLDMASNGIDITMVDGDYGYSYDLTAETFVQITDSNFPGGNNIVQIDGYYLVNRPNTGQIWRSDFNTGLSWNGLAFSTAGGDPDNIVSIIVDHLDVWIIGERSTEIWYNTGASTFNFARIDGAFIEQGGSSAFSKTKANNAVYWLGVDNNGLGQVFQALGRSPKVISTYPISNAISKYELSDAIMFSYQQEGHTFIVLTFPISDKTWVYDSTTKYWHERSSKISGVDKRWRINCHALFKGRHIVGDYINGLLYEMKTDVYDEAGDPLVAVRTTPVIRTKQNPITIDMLQVLTEPGVGVTTGSSEDINPQMMFSWSKDGGSTWSQEIDVSMGKIGETYNRAIIDQLGQGRNWVFRIRISAAVKRVILSAQMEAEEDEN